MRCRRVIGDAAPYESIAESAMRGEYGLRIGDIGHRFSMTFFLQHIVRCVIGRRGEGTPPYGG